MTAAVARPFVKWVGGKGALVDELLPRLPERIGTYYEPFLGGGAVFFTLAVEGRFKRARLNDANMSLIYVYEMITAHVDGLIERLHAHAKRHCESYYYEVRSQDPLRMNVLDQAARFLYLNRTCFNGLYRVNKKGEFNVPFGKYKNPTICDEKNLRAVSMLLKATKARITSQDFEKAVQGAKDGDTVYFDPPYVPASETSNFTAFTKGGFGLAEQIRLRDCFKTLDERGVHVLLSNSDTHLVRELYKGFRLTEVKAPRRVNSRGDKRGDVGELLISGGA